MARCRTFARGYTRLSLTESNQQLFYLWFSKLARQYIACACPTVSHELIDISIIPLAGIMGSSRDKELQKVEEIIQYRFTNRALLEEALHAAGSLYSVTNRYSFEGNKKLAVVGDSAADLVINIRGYRAGKSRGSCLFDLSFCSHDRLTDSCKQRRCPPQG